jgi:hypothetical protein
VALVECSTGISYNWKNSLVVGIIRNVEHHVTALYGDPLVFCLAGFFHLSSLLELLQKCYFLYLGFFLSRTVNLNFFFRTMPCTKHLIHFKLSLYLEANTVDNFRNHSIHYSYDVLLCVEKLK